MGLRLILCIVFISSGLFAGDLNFKDLSGILCQPMKVAKNKKANVLCFVTVDCPISNGYSPRFNQLAKKYSELGFEFYLVHIDWDTSIKMAKQHKKDYSLIAKILIDSKHLLVKQTGVSITPEVAVILADGTTAYRGRIDNWYEGFGKRRNVVTKTELKDALEAIVQGKKILISKTKSVGCAIPDLPKK